MKELFDLDEVADTAAKPFSRGSGKEFYENFDSSNTALIHRDLADYGFAHLRDILFDSVRVLWKRRMDEGVTFQDISKRIDRPVRWVREKYSAPGQWTLRCAGELISALDGEAEIKIAGLEDPVYTPRFGFGDSLDYNGEKVFVIGEHITSTDAYYSIVVANRHSKGKPVKGNQCKILGSGFHSYCIELQEKYLIEYPGTLKGLFP